MEFRRIESVVGLPSGVELISASKVQVTSEFTQAMYLLDITTAFNTLKYDDLEKEMYRWLWGTYSGTASYGIQMWGDNGKAECYATITHVEPNLNTYPHRD